MTRQKFGEEAREVLLKGATEVYNAVSPTMGARGRNVVRQNFGQPKITNDGVTIARSIQLEDPFERQGADLIKQAADKTVDEAGDGTTGAIVLAHTLFKNGLELIKQGHNPMVLRKQIEEEADKVLLNLKEMAIPVSTDEELNNIATISIENPEYGKIVAHAVKTAGKDGLVVVEEDYKPGIQSEEVNGYQFDRGLEIPYLVGDANRMITTFPLKGEEDKKVPILVADKSWNLTGDLLPLIDSLKREGHDKLLIIAEEVSGEFAAFLVKNRLSLRFHAVVVKPPFNKDMLEDIAVLTGATAITNLKGIVNVKKEHLGWAKKVIVTQTTTTIIDGDGDVTKQVEDLRGQVEHEDIEHLKVKLQERLSKLTGKTVILKVGADTEAEARYLKDKLDDAVAATKAAVEEGVVAGGGMALFRIGTKISSLSPLMVSVLNAPFEKIVDNSGVKLDKEFIGKMLEGETTGFDALTGNVVKDIVKHGIIDPAKVVRCSFKNAVSLACMLLTIECVIAEMPQKNES
jgi:chaperonin GroEL